MKPTLGLQLFVDDCIDFGVIAPQFFRIVNSNAEKGFPKDIFAKVWRCTKAPS